MSFCSFSTESIISDKTEIDNIFLSEFMPYAPESAVKVFLYGLYMCSHADSHDNNIESFSKALSLSSQDVESCFLYWQEQGLVRVISTDPISIRYIPIKNAITGTKKYNKDKFENFNAQAQEVLRGRMITPNEYSEYYDLLERYHFEEDALIMIIQYCVSLKGESVGYKYILTVAKNWAGENVTTADDVKEKLHEFENHTDGLSLVSKALSTKRSLSYCEHEMYTKWTEKLGFDLGTIIAVAKENKKKKTRFEFENLDSLLSKYYEMQLLSTNEIEEFEKTKDGMKDLAKHIVKSLGLFYENLDSVIENYISPWISRGFSRESLLLISSFCFKKSIRTLEGMNGYVQKFFKLGLTSEGAISSYISDVSAADIEIKNLLEKLGVERNVSSFDRELFKTWTENWKIPKELFDYGVSLATGKAAPMQYLSRLFSVWNEKGVETKEEAMKNQTIFTPIEKKNDQVIISHNLSSSQLNALFDSLEEIEI